MSQSAPRAPKSPAWGSPPDDSFPEFGTPGTITKGTQGGIGGIGEFERPGQNSIPGGWIGAPQSKPTPPPPEFGPSNPPSNPPEFGGPLPPEIDYPVGINDPPPPPSFGGLQPIKPISGSGYIGPPAQSKPTTGSGYIGPPAQAPGPEPISDSAFLGPPVDFQPSVTPGVTQPSGVGFSTPTVQQGVYGGPSLGGYFGGDGFNAEEEQGRRTGALGRRIVG